MLPVECMIFGLLMIQCSYIVLLLYPGFSNVVPFFWGLLSPHSFNIHTILDSVFMLSVVAYYRLYIVEVTIANFNNVSVEDLVLFGWMREVIFC